MNIPPAVLEAFWGPQSPYLGVATEARAKIGLGAALEQLRAELEDGEAIEAAARSNYEANRRDMFGPRSNPEWDNAFDPMKDVGRKHARHNISATLSHVLGDKGGEG